jgi:hypothetical protein
VQVDLLLPSLRAERVPRAKARPAFAAGAAGGSKLLSLQVLRDSLGRAGLLHLLRATPPGPLRLHLCGSAAHKVVRFLLRSLCEVVLCAVLRLEVWNSAARTG